MLRLRNADRKGAGFLGQPEKPSVAGALVGEAQGEGLWARKLTLPLGQ